MCWSNGLRALSRNDCCTVGSVTRALMAALLDAVDRLGGVQDRGVEQSQVQIDVIVGDVL